MFDRNDASPPFEGGRTMTLSEAAATTGVPYKTIINAVNRRMLRARRLADPRRCPPGVVSSAVPYLVDEIDLLAWVTKRQRLQATLSLTEAARLVKLDRRNLYRAIYEGRLRTERILGQTRVTPDALEDWRATIDPKVVPGPGRPKAVRQ